MNEQKLLQQNKVILVSNLIPKEFCYFFTHVLLRKADTGPTTDPQVPFAKAVMGHELMFDTLLEYMWQPLENILGEELLPTYSYARLYSNGDVLEEHTDREACEVSVTIQLGKSDSYSWPITMGSKKYVLNEGDGVIYSGCDVRHKRDVCLGPNDYYSGQVFLHYVRKNGSNANELGDPTNRKPPVFLKNRIARMEKK